MEKAPALSLARHRVSASLMFNIKLLEFHLNYVSKTSLKIIIIKESPYMNLLCLLNCHLIFILFYLDDQFILVLKSYKSFEEMLLSILE